MELSGFGPTYIFLLEVRIPHARVGKIKSKMGFHSMFYVDNVNIGGGLALM